MKKFLSISLVTAFVLFCVPLMMALAQTALESAPADTTVTEDFSVANFVSSFGHGDNDRDGGDDRGSDDRGDGRGDDGDDRGGDDDRGDGRGDDDHGDGRGDDDRGDDHGDGRGDDHDNGDKDKVMVCHYPAGNLENPQLLKNQKWSGDTGHSGHEFDFVVTHEMGENYQCPPIYKCSDKIDNDEDGLIDFGSDPGCESANDNDEYNAPVEKKATLHAQKIVCDEESDLPNWGAGGVDIFENTASNWLAENSEKGCYLTDWDFEWAYSNTIDPDDNIPGTAGAGWTPFVGGTAVIDISNDNILRIREIFDTNYIPFTGENTDQNVSAEFYCGNDNLHYDNWEWLTATPDTDYYCVAWNVPKSQTPDPVFFTLAYIAGADGTISGSSTQSVEQNGTGTAVTAIANSGYHFVNWSDESTENPRTDSGVTGNKTVTANFAIDQSDNKETTKTTSRTTTSGSRKRVVAPAGEVLGASTEIPNTCGIYLNSYIKKGKSNITTDVIKLQQFLNEELGKKLPLTGFYGNETEKAVREFQLKYSDDVLVPWINAGLHKNKDEATGYVYKTTQRKINLIKCLSLNIPMPELK